MNQREKSSPLEREAWRTTADALEKCHAGANELDRMMEDAKQAARDAELFMLRITAGELTPD